MKNFLKKLRVRFRLWRNPANAVIKGECIKCGECCRQLLLVHDGKVVQTAAQFEELLEKYPEYRNFRIKGIDDDGDMRFECTCLEPDNTCSIHPRRPAICADYPRQGMFLKEGKLLEGCGYNAEPEVSFEDILETEKSSR